MCSLHLILVASSSLQLGNPFLWGNSDRPPVGSHSCTLSGKVGEVLIENFYYYGVWQLTTESRVGSRSTRPGNYKIILGIHTERATEASRQVRDLEKMVLGPNGADIALLKLQTWACFFLMLLYSSATRIQKKTFDIGLNFAAAGTQTYEPLRGFPRQFDRCNLKRLKATALTYEILCALITFETPSIKFASNSVSSALQDLVRLLAKAFWHF